MSIVNKATGIALAIAAASMIGCASPGKSSTASAGNIKCFGVNKCGGHNDCKTADSKCKGHGSCKGKGFVKMSKSACKNIGGNVG